MKKFERHDVAHLFDRLSQGSQKRIIAINGPRQVGKTTIALQLRSRLIKSRIPCWYMPMDDFYSSESDWLKVRIDDGQGNANQDLFEGEVIRHDVPPNERLLFEIWKKARSDSMKSENGLVLIFDEIQTIQRWSNLVKGLWDTDQRQQYPLRVVILGSAPWRLMIGQNESLAGRFDSYQVTHWSLPEITLAFGATVEEFMFYGGYPEPFTRGSKGIVLRDWRDYIIKTVMTPVLDRDIIGLTRIQNPALMRQLVDLAPRYSGQVISYNKLLGKLQDAGNATTLASYLTLLSDANLIAALDQYSNSPQIGKKSSPKLNVLNTALMTATSGYSFKEAQADRSYWGRIVESSVGAHLYNTRDTATHIHYWRHDGGQYEVDFVISRGPHLLAVEVKSGNKQDYRGLNEFRDRFKGVKTMQIGPKAIPFNEFFSLTADDWIDKICVK